MPKMPKVKSFSGILSENEARQQAEPESNQANELPHLVIRALAGTGKSTTMLEGLRLMVEGKTSLLPTEQQSAIWEQILKSTEAKSICMVAFNKEIADELDKRIPRSPPGSYPSVCAMTLHSLGNRAIRSSLGSCNIDSDRSKKILADLRKVSFEELMAKSGNFAYEVAELVSKCKIHCKNHASYDRDDLEEFNEIYKLDFNLSLEHDLAVKAVLKSSEAYQGSIDYDDMIWLPLVSNLVELPKWDLLFIDEGSDLDLAQQEFVMKIGRRIVFCGDPQQAIYAFRGSDSKSFNRMAAKLKADRETIELPLTVTYRCSQAVAREAQKWVADFECHPDNPEGSVSDVPYRSDGMECSNCKKWEFTLCSNGLSHWFQCNNCHKNKPAAYHHWVKDGDMIICRNNAPLVAECLRFIKDGRKAYIKGRKDIAKGLTKLVRRLARQSSDKESIPRFRDQLEIWKNLETAKADANKDDRQAAYVQDRYECILHFLIDGHIKNVSLLVNKIENLFNDKEQKGIMLGTIHQVKGLESDNVFFLMPKGAECPASWSKTKDQQEQEKHLRYIGITRSKLNLYYVS